MESWPNSMVRAAVRRAVRARCMWGVGGTLEGEHELLTALRAARRDEGESSGVASMSESDDVQAATGSQPAVQAGR